MNRGWQWKWEADTFLLLTIPDMRVPDRLWERQPMLSSMSAICSMQAVWRWKHLMVLSLLHFLSHSAALSRLHRVWPDSDFKIIYYSKVHCSSFAWKGRNMPTAYLGSFEVLTGQEQTLHGVINNPSRQRIARNIDNSIRDGLRHMADTPKLISREA